MITIALAEDHQSLIDGIRLALETQPDLDLVAEANDGEQLIKQVLLKQPKVVVTDLRMPKCDGMMAIREIKKEFPNIRVIAFSMFDKPEAISQMRAAGANGYVMKNAPLKTLLQAIRTVAAGDEFFDDSIIAFDQTKQENIILSQREKEILRLIGEGKTSQEIASELFIGKTTVDTHRKNILKKLQVHGKTDLIRFAVERKYEF